MYELKFTLRFVIILLVGTMLVISSCAVGTGYKKLDFAPESMSKFIDIGSSIAVETEDFFYPITVTGYEGNELLIGKLDINGREVRIPFDDIVEISTEQLRLTSPSGEPMGDYILDKSFEAGIYLILIAIVVVIVAI